MKQDDQVTYIKGEEIIDHVLDYLRDVVAGLERVRTDDLGERTSMLLDSVLQQERELVANMERFTKDADRKAMETYAQYTVELPEEVEAPEAPHSTLSITQWLLRCNERLVALFAEQANTTDVQEYKDAFGGLSQQVESQNRKLSKEYQRWEDL